MKKAATFKTAQEVVLTETLRDADGRLLVEAGARGQVCCPVDPVPGLWLVHWHAVGQGFPAFARVLRPASPVQRGPLDPQRLSAVVEAARYFLQGGDLDVETKIVASWLKEALEYVLGYRDGCSFVNQIVGNRPPRCRCRDSGECQACEGRGGKCKSCRGSGFCAKCPRPQTQTLTLGMLLETIRLEQSGQPVPRALVASLGRARRAKAA